MSGVMNKRDWARLRAGNLAATISALRAAEKRFVADKNAFLEAIKGLQPDPVCKHVVISSVDGVNYCNGCYTDDIDIMNDGGLL